MLGVLLLTFAVGLQGRQFFWNT